MDPDVRLDPAPLDRRAFVGLGAAGLAAVAAVGCRTRERSDATTPGADAGSFALEERTIRELQDDMASGARTSASICEAYLDRIEANDRRGPGLRSMLDLNPEALDIAGRLDRERAGGDVRGPLHGIPVILKDNIDTADRTTTTAGSLALEGRVAVRDAFVAGRLREAGAVILGKANLSEWANFRSTRSSSGWSGRGGQCGNPYAIDRSPCGSSAGTGAAVSANFAAVGVGTETDGSIVCPSSMCGLVGIKPTLGLVSRTGIIPIAHSQDTAGPMARTVEDAAVLLGVMAGADPDDRATGAAPAPRDYTGALDPAGLEGARIGVARNLGWGGSPDADAVGEAAVEALRAAGANVIDPAEVPHADDYGDSEFEVLLYEFKTDLDACLGALGPDARVHGLEDVIAFNEANRARSMPFFGQEIMLMAAEKGPLTEPAYTEALARNRRLSRTEGIDAVMDAERLDALVSITVGPAWTIDLVNGDHYGGGSSTPAAVAGYPHVTVPGGDAFGLPVGISFFGRAWSEPTLIRLAYAFERATTARRAPGLAPTLGLRSA